MLSQALESVLQAFVKEYGDLAVERVEVEEWELSKLLDVLSAQPFLSPKRLVIMKGLAANKSAGEAIIKLLEAVSGATDLVLVEHKIDKRSVLYKTLKKHTEYKEFAETDPHALPAWLRAYAHEQGGVLSLADAQYLVQRIGTSQEALVSEVSKLLLYDGHVSRRAIDLLTDQAPLSSIFELIEAAFMGHTQKALQLYDDQRAQNVEALAIEALFVWQLHVVLLVKTAGSKSADTVAADANMSSYVTRKSATLAAMRSYDQLKQYTSRLAELEYTLKRRMVHPDEAMKNFIVSLSA